MTKEEVLDRHTFGLTDYVGYWPEEAVMLAMDEYAKSQIIAFLKNGIKEMIIYPTTDETICIDGKEYNDKDFDTTVSVRYDQFIEQQNKDNG